jgi:WD40 repeat protein/serine/threonine protein kinase/tetratricopeptide (TPR) repeat protein
MATWNPQANDLFLKALALHVPAARQEYLDGVCAGDAALRTEVEALLDAHDRAGSFLDRPAHTVGPTGEFAAASENETATIIPREFAGTVIGPYKLLQQIGAGGMGVVFMAEQTHPIQRKVALKIIKPGMDTAQVIARFEAERQALAMMDHVNIARVLDAGTTGEPGASATGANRALAANAPVANAPGSPGRPYFVMELVHGVPITKYCDDNHLTPRERLELFVPVCNAIQHAHQKGIIHRDIKPSNVMVTLYDGKPVPKVIDFGVAKATEQKLTERTLFTQYGTMVGTLEYMSPEQAEMSALGVDTRSDIYSLGVLLYELLTGSTPLTHKRMKEAAYAEILRMIKEEEPPKPSTRLSDSGEALASISALRNTEPAKLTKLVKGELDWIVMKTLEKDRNRRYETANGFAMDLQRYLADEPVQACPPSVGYRFRKFARRNKSGLAVAAVVAAALVLAVAGLAVSNWIVMHERDQKTQALSDKEKALANESAALTIAKEKENLANERAEEAKKQQEIAKNQTALATRRLYAAQMNLAMQSSSLGEWPRVLELLEGQRPTESGEDLRGFEWYYLWRLCLGGRRVPIRGHQNSVLGLAFSPDGRTLASASWDNTVRLWDTSTGAERLVMRGHRFAPWAVAYSPDGRLLASSGQETGSLIIWGATTGKPLHTIPHSVAGFAFSPDSKRLAAGIASGEKIDAVLWDTSTGAEIKRIEGAGCVAGFTANGKSLVTFTGQHKNSGEVHCWDLDQARRRYQFPAPGLCAAVLSPDRTRVVAGMFGGTSVHDASTGEPMALNAGPAARGIALSPDNKLLACGMENRRVAVVSLETGRAVFEDAHLHTCWTVAFSPDGKQFASASGTGAIHLRDVAPEEATVLAAKWVRALTFSADGRRLFVGNSGRTKIIDVTQGTEIAQLPQADVVAISANLQTLARADGDGKLTAWETDSGRVIAEVPLPLEHHWPGLALSPDGKLAAAHCPWVPDPTVRLCDLSLHRSKTLKSDRSAISVHCAEFSPDGSQLAAGFQFYTVTVWDVSSGRVKWEIALGTGMTNILSLAWAPDGHRLAVGTDVGFVTIWDTRTGVRTALIRGHAMPVRALAFSPDGKTLTTGSNDGTIKLWDTITGQERCTLAGHKLGVTKLRFSPDGNTLASASDDGTLRLWRGSADRDALARRPDPKPIVAPSAEAFTAHQSALALLRGERVEERDAIEAIELTKKAIGLRPGLSAYWQTLAIAHFRAGHWREAITALDESEKTTVVTMGQHKLVRAMALWKLDRKEEARAVYQAAADRIDKRLAFDEETDRFRAEAARMLGLPVPNAADALPPTAARSKNQLDELRRTSALLDKRAAASPKKLWDRWKLANEYHELAFALAGFDRLEEAEIASRQAVKRFQQIATEESRYLDHDNDVAYSTNLLAGLLQRSGRFEESILLFQESLRRFETMARNQPDRPVHLDAMGTVHAQLADSLRKLDKPVEAARAEHAAFAARQAAEKLRRRPQPEEFLARAKPFAEKRNWKQAADELNKGFQDQPRTDPHFCYSTALARLLADDIDGYTSLVKQCPTRHSSAEWPHHLTCLRTLHARGAADAAALVQTAQAAYDWEVHGWSAQILGMALYRAKKFDKALPHLQEAMKLRAWYVDWPALAMTHHQLGHADEAKKWLDKANEYHRQVTETSDEPLKVTKQPYWQDWAYFELLLREANALMKEGSKK